MLSRRRTISPSSVSNRSADSNSRKRIRNETIREYASVSCFGNVSSSNPSSGGADLISSTVCASNMESARFLIDRAFYLFGELPHPRSEVRKADNLSTSDGDILAWYDLVVALEQFRQLWFRVVTYSARYTYTESPDLLPYDSFNHFVWISNLSTLE